MGKPIPSINLEKPVFELIESGNSIFVLEENKKVEKYTKEQFAEKRIIHPGMADTDVLNAFRDLRTTILPKLDKFNSVVQISAAHAGGGASFNALNLAVSCTFDHHRHALLVECNFERPSLAETLNVNPHAGLYDFLTDGVEDIADIIYPTGIPRLNLVPSGQVVSSAEDYIEFFTGENMRLFLEDVRNRYDDRIIIIDAPPLLESADAKILAEVTDHVLLVIPYKGASASKVNKMIKAAGKDKVVGVVLNN